MPVEWTRAPTVNAGQYIGSSQRNILARAFNDRLRSGIGDAAWRVAYGLYQPLRNLVHNKSLSELEPGEGWTPDQAVYERYHNITPDSPTDLWPANPPGESGGISQSSVLGAYIFGNGANQDEVFPEYQRTNGIVVSPILSDTQAWDNAGSQRGWILDTKLDDFSNAKVINEAYIWDQIAENGWNDWTFGAWQRFSSFFEPLLTKKYNFWREFIRHLYAREYRGSDAQRQDADYFLQNTFDMAGFFGMGFHLAPARMQAGDSVPRYPRWETTSNLPAGSPIPAVPPFFPGYTWHEKFVCGKFRIRGEKLLSPVTLRVSHASGEWMYNVPAGDSGVLYDARFERLQGVNVSVLDALTLDTDGYLGIEFTEILDYKPGLPELATVLRLGGARDSTNWDGRGTQTDLSDYLWESYVKYGAIDNVQNNSNGLPDISPTVNANGYYESTRHFTSRHLAMPHRSSFVTMAYQNGVQSLWFKRYDPLRSAQDNFEAIYPIVHAAEANGETNEWVMEVDLAPYDDSAIFWTPDVYADQHGFHNRALFAADELRDKLNTDHLHQHVCWMPTTTAVNKRYEAPSLFNYAMLHPNAHPTGGTANSPLNPYAKPDSETNKERFFASCRIYEPPVEVETVEDIPPVAMEWLTENGDAWFTEASESWLTEPNEHQVRIDFKTRLHTSDQAPAEYAPEYWNWDPATLQAETDNAYRSNENGLRMYLLKWYWDWNPHWAIGDQGLNGVAWGTQPIVTQLKASIFPHFRFVHLLPECYIDTNNVQNPWDTKFLHDYYTQAECYLRHMCEGYLDTTFGLRSDEACNRYMREWRYDDLIWYVSGERYEQIPPMPVVETEYLNNGDLRTDAPHGFGPLPTVKAAAEHFNLLSNAMNLLTAVRLPWQVSLEQRYDQYSDVQQAGYSDKEPTNATCPDSVVLNGVAGHNPTTPSIVPPPDWEPGTGYNAYYSWDIDPSCSGSEYNIRAQRATYEFRIKEDDIVYWEKALPPDVQALISNQDIAVPVQFAEYLTVAEKTPDSPGDCGLGYAFTQKRICIEPAGEEPECQPGFTTCKFLFRGSWNPSAPPSGQYPLTNCQEGSGQELTRTIELTTYAEAGIALGVPLKTGVESP